MTVELILPDVRCRASYLEAVREFQAEGRHQYEDAKVLAQDFSAYVRALRERRHLPRPGMVPETVLWLVDGDLFIGRASVRHRLNDHLRRIGGHIGYEIRPTQRRRGYGTLICKLALAEARRIGLDRALITCDEDNVGSRRIIEANGGIFERAVRVAGSPVKKLHFWVDLKEQTV